jgi:hypothetical protein
MFFWFPINDGETGLFPPGNEKAFFFDATIFFVRTSNNRF